MLKLLKYELKSRKNILLGGSLTIILLNILLIFDLKVNRSDAFGFSLDNNGTLGSILGIVLFALWVASIVLIIMDSINILRKDLYEDTGQLLFTVPRSSYSILLSKMLMTIIELLLFGLLFGILLGSLFVAEGMDLESTNRLMQAIGDNVGFIMQVLFAIFTGIMVVLATIYFALVLTKSLLKDKKYSGITSFGVFLLLNFIISKVNNWLFEYMPYSSSSGMTLKLNNVVMELPLSTGESIGIILFNICIFVILFISTGYLLENKADI